MSIDLTLKNKLEYYDVKQIAPKVYKINEYNLSTMFVIVGENRALVLDCGTGVGDFKSIVENLVEGKPYDLALTHAHVDHVGGRGQFDKLFVHEKDACIIKDATVLYRKFYLFLVRLKFKCLSFKKAVINKVDKEPDVVTFKEGFTFDLGGRTVVAIDSPGHTLGSTSFLLKEDKILFSGDTANPQMLMFLSHSTTILEFSKTLEKLKALEGYETIWPSHLSRPISPETFDEIYQTTQKIMHKNKFNWLLSIPAVAKTKKTVIIYINSNIKNRMTKKD
jgi:glyoxylase-like metal-dependent hydrolase (beta-lactamase superfamily II)